MIKSNNAMIRYETMIEANKRCCFWSIFSKKELAKVKKEADDALKTEEKIIEKELPIITIELTQEIEKIKQPRWPSAIESTLAPVTQMFDQSCDDDMHSCYTQSSDK